MIRRVRLVTCATLLVLAPFGLADKAQAQAGSPQQQFDAASTLFEAGQWQQAAEAFARARRILPSGAKRGQAVAAIRQGHAFFRMGKFDEAIAPVEEGLAVLPSDPALNSDRLLGYQTLAQSYERTLQYPLARSAYESALALAVDQDARLSSLTGIARTAMFDEPVAAAGAVNRALALLGSAQSEAVNRAVLLDLRGRAKLNAGNRPDALQDFLAALNYAGGLTSKSDALDLAIRADIGLTALLSGDERMAHQYLAASGTARDASGALPIMKNAAITECTGSQSPADLVVVELKVGNDGEASEARPIFSSRGEELGLALARTVNVFRWDPEKLVGMQGLRRSALRIEMHCSAASVDHDALDRLTDPRKVWRDALKIPDFDPGASGERARMIAARQELARREKAFGTMSVQLFPVLEVLAANALVPIKESREIYYRQAEIARAARAPIAVEASLAVKSAVVAMSNEGDAGRLLKPILSDQRFARDIDASSYLRYTTARTISLIDRSASAENELIDLARSDQLPATNPYRRAASLALFHINHNRSPKLAAEFLHASGVPGNPCGLARLTPKDRPSSSVFPTEALRWGFEGWVMLESNVMPDGSVQNQRTMVAYPPLVFSASANRASRRLHYRVTESFTSTPSCKGMVQSLNFRLPH